MHLLDTDALTHLMTGQEAITRRLAVEQVAVVGTTVVTKIELLRGRFDFLLKAANGEELMRAQERLSRTERFLSDVLVVLVDAQAAQRFDRLRAAPGLRKIGRADLLIASIALAHQATLVTRNVRHFRPITGLAVENWID